MADTPDTDTPDTDAPDTDTPALHPAGFSHVRLTVTDIARSKDFYRRLLGVDPAADFNDQTVDPTVFDDPDRLYGGCAFPLGDGSQLLGLRPVASAGDRFDPTRVGLDHVSLAMGSPDDLAQAADRLDAAGITHGTVKELGDLGMAILSVQDPDDINLELAAPLPAAS